MARSMRAEKIMPGLFGWDVPTSQPLIQGEFCEIWGVTEDVHFGKLGAFGSLCKVALGNHSITTVCRVSMSWLFTFRFFQNELRTLKPNNKDGDWASLQGPQKEPPKTP